MKAPSQISPLPVYNIPPPFFKGRKLVSPPLYYLFRLPSKIVASPTYLPTVFFSLYEPFNKLRRYSHKASVQNIWNT